MFKELNDDINLSQDVVQAEHHHQEGEPGPGGLGIYFLQRDICISISIKVYELNFNSRVSDFFSNS